MNATTSIPVEFAPTPMGSMPQIVPVLHPIPHHQLVPGRQYRLTVTYGSGAARWQSSAIVMVRRFCGELCYEVGHRIESVCCESKDSVFTEVEGGTK